QGETRFDRYDPLGVIPSDHVLDWQYPDCSINCELNLHQLE
ncbi:MAG: cell division protein FtsZ, partial [Thermoproteota archaeon]